MLPTVRLEVCSYAAYMLKVCSYAAYCQVKGLLLQVQHLHSLLLGPALTLSTVRSNYKLSSVRSSPFAAYCQVQLLRCLPTGPALALSSVRQNYMLSAVRSSPNAAFCQVQLFRCLCLPTG